MTQSKITQYFEQNSELRILFVFDPLGDLHGEIQAFAWDAPYRVERFAGDWFATKSMLADLDDSIRMILLMPMQNPLGIDEEMRAFPLLGELCANTYYSDENYQGFMTANGLPNNVTQFVRRHLSDLQLAKYEKVLAPHYGANFTENIGCRGILSVLIGESIVREWRELIMRLWILDAEDGASQKKKNSVFSSLLTDPRYADVLAALKEELRRTFGVGIETTKDIHFARAAQAVRYNTVVQNLPVQAADNYKTFRNTDGIVINRMNQFLLAASELPDKSRNAFFKAFEILSADIHMGHIADVYGVEADYGAYPPALCREVLQKLAQQNVAKKADSIRARAQLIAERAEAGKRMRMVASYLIASAETYLALGKMKTVKLNAPADYVFAYVGEWQDVDRCYRMSIEKFHEIASDEDKAIVEGVKSALDVDYLLKTNEANEAWVESLNAEGGRKALEQFQMQENFAQQIIDSSIKHAVIVSDGLRYEVAKEIEERVNAGRHKASLTPSIGMLPSETKYCKPVLLPHMGVELVEPPESYVKIDGACVDSIKERQNILFNCDYERKANCINAQDLTNMSPKEKRELFKSSLVYIYHDVIDDASHGKPGAEVVASCRKAIDELVQLIVSLHSSYNVVDVWLVSDHGFVMNDIRFEDKDKIPIPCEENAQEKTSRYYLTRSAKAIPGVVKFRLSEVSAFDTNLMVAVPRGTARFAAPGGYVYAHGGASLQEMVIPVLQSRQLRSDAREKVGVSLVDNKLTVVSSQLRVRLLQDNVATSIVQGRKICCALFDGDAAVSAEKSTVMDSTKTDPNERLQTIELTLNAQTGEKKIANTLTLKVWDAEDSLNPLIRVSVTNNTLIERDF